MKKVLIFAVCSLAITFTGWLIFDTYRTSYSDPAIKVDQRGEQSEKVVASEIVDKADKVSTNSGAASEDGFDAHSRVLRASLLKNGKAVMPVSTQELKKKINKEYYAKPPADLFALAEKGDVDAALLAAEIMTSCHSGITTSSEEQCAISDRDILRKRLRYGLAAAKGNPMMDVQQLLFTGVQLKRSGVPEEQDRQLIKQALIQLHESAALGNNSAILALGTTYLNGNISNVNRNYALAFLSLATPTEDSQPEVLARSVYKQMRAGDLMVQSEMANKARHQSFPPDFGDW